MQKIYNYENENPNEVISTYELNGVEVEVKAPPLSSVERLGYTEYSEVGEVLSVKRTAMHPIPQVGVPRGPQDVGSPKLVLLSKPSDLKRRIINMINADSIHSLYGAVDNTTDDDFNRFCSDDSDDVDSFNKAMSNTPYACDENGVSNIERDYNSSQAEAMAVQNAVAQMQNPLFQEFANLPDDVKQNLLTQAQQTIENQPVGEAGGAQPKPEA